MDNVKDKMYNYETTPPAGVWEAIVSQLESNEAKVIPLTMKSSKRFYYLAAASVAIIIFCFIFFAQHSGKSQKEGFVLSPDTKNINRGADTATTTKNDKPVISVPAEEKITERKKSNEQVIVKNAPLKGKLNDKAKNENPETSDGKSLANNNDSRYITIEGIEGKPVKVSTKMASLIDSSDEKMPPKPSWNKKINEWREIMKGNTLAPTPGNFLDIIELTKTLKDHK